MVEFANAYHTCCLVRCRLSSCTRVLVTLIAKYVTTPASSTDTTRMISVVTTVLRAQRFFSRFLILDFTEEFLRFFLI